MKKILLLAADKNELLQTKKALNLKKHCYFGIIGIGSIEAGIKTTTLISKLNPSRVIFIGSCGAVSKKLPLLTPCLASSVSWKDLAVKLKLSYLPKNPNQYFACKRFIRSALSKERNLPIVKAYSTPSISLSAKKKQSIEIENLELYGIAAACKANKIPWNYLGVVTNYLGKNAHLEWKKNRKRAANITAEILDKVLNSRSAEL